MYDPIVQEWTELFIYKIGEKSKVSNKTFEVLLIRDNNLNAFAAPGGIIGVNAGLFKYADNEAQYASVVAHELAHLSQRHFARQILESSDRSNASLATVLASIVVAVATQIVELQKDYCSPLPHHQCIQPTEFSVAFLV